MILINNEMVPENQAFISVKDRGFRLGDGVFETIPVYEGVPYQWELHENRLKQGLMATRINFDVSGLKNICGKLLNQNKLANCILRIAITRGEGGKGYLPPENPCPNIVIETLPMAEKIINPVSLWLSSVRKIPPYSLPVHVKTMQGLNSTLARMEAMDNNCFESLMLGQDDYITECSSANIFWIKGDMIFTPSLESGILPGITRDAIIRIAPYKINEGKFKVKDLENAEEVFITNSAWRIVKINELKPLNFKWKTGRVTGAIQELLESDIKKYVSSQKSALG